MLLRSRLFGKECETPKSEWKEVVRHVTYDDHRSHRQIVEDSFQYHLDTDIGYLQKHHPDHFSAPHNVDHAIVLYHYFRNHLLFVKDERYNYIATKDLPARPADSQAIPIPYGLSRPRHRSDLPLPSWGP